MRLQSADIQYGYLKGHVNVTCEAIADPLPQFHWYRNNKLLDPKHYQIVSTEYMSVLQVNFIAIFRFEFDSFNILFKFFFLALFK